MASLAVYLNWHASRLVLLGVLCVLGFSFGSFRLLRLDVSCRQLHDTASCLRPRHALCVLSLVDRNLTLPPRTQTDADADAETQRVRDACDDATLDSLRALLYGVTDAHAHTPPDAYAHAHAYTEAHAHAHELSRGDADGHGRGREPMHSLRARPYAVTDAQATQPHVPAADANGQEDADAHTDADADVPRRL
jgi:hypothetical protein